MPSAKTKVGHGLAKVFGIRPDPYGTSKARADHTSTSDANVEPYEEAEPTVAEWLQSISPSGGGVLRYLYGLFPFLHWITKYNMTWLLGDFIAGATVGAVVVPQSMAYAKLALLPVEYGLYSSFMGVLLYWFFATSKDITIGPVAVMSTVTGTVVAKAQEAIPDVPGHIVASALAVMCGVIITFLGLARLGWLVEFITLPAICAFMTGSAINIASGQVPKMLGTSKLFSTREQPYKVIINTLKHLPDTTIDAAMGLTALTMLYLIRYACKRLSRKYPHRAKLFFFLSTLRTAFVILLYTAISAGVNLHRRDNPLFSIVGEVPRGFQHAEVPRINKRIISSFVSELPGSVIVILIEHISISKSFGRINNYVIDPSQELIAIGVTNLLGPFLGAYPATGSFSRTAIKSKSGVRTPFAGVITAVVVLLALYALTAVFFYIPDSALGAVIIHAVLDVITPPNTVYQMWRISPLEVLVFFAGVFVTIFSSIENGIYTTIVASFALLVFRMFLAKGRFLGVVRLRSHGVTTGANSTTSADSQPLAEKGNLVIGEGSHPNRRNLFLPVGREDGSNPRISTSHPYPGVFIFQFTEAFSYPNSSRYLDELTTEIFKLTRRTDPGSLGKLGDRPWNNPGPRNRKNLLNDVEIRPTLKAIILDCASANFIDVTSIQALIDVRNQLDKYSSPDTVHWHFANVKNRWTRRGLAVAGFGFLTPTPTGPPGEQGTGTRWKPVFSAAEILDGVSLQPTTPPIPVDIETGKPVSSNDVTSDDKGVVHRAESVESSAVPVYGLNRPLFHPDLQEAVDSAIANIQGKTH